MNESNNGCGNKRHATFQPVSYVLLQRKLCVSKDRMLEQYRLKNVSLQLKCLPWKRFLPFWNHSFLLMQNQRCVSLLKYQFEQHFTQAYGYKVRYLKKEIFVVYLLVR